MRNPTTPIPFSAWRVCLFGLLLIGSVSAQSILGEQEIKDIDIDDIVYPYESLDSGGRINYIAHEPAVKLSEGEFAYIWKSRKKSERTRILATYNVLLEERWQTRFKLEVGEVELKLFRHDDYLVLLTYEYEWQDRTHLICVRKFDLATGEEPEREIIHSLEGPESREFFVDFSPDMQQFIVYHYDRFDEGKGFAIFFDYLYSDEFLGHRVNRAEILRFTRFSTALDTLGEEDIVINADASTKVWGMGCQVDNAGNVYATVYEEKTTLTVYQNHATTGKTRSLSYDKYPNLYKVRDPFDTHLPVEVGNNEKAYIAVAERERIRGRQQLQAYQLVTFDFAKDELSEIRKVEIGSQLIVGVAKRKRAFGLKVDKTFDRYLIKEIIEMPDESVWLVTQRYEFDNLSGNFYETRSFLTNPTARIEEAILYEFAPDGSFRKAVVLPSFQQPDDGKGIAGHFYRMFVDRESYEMQFITYERSGENLRGPHRVFYRKVNLQTGETTPRTQLYEGDKKGQGFFKMYTIWLTTSVVALLVEDGYNGKKYAVSVALEQ